MYNKFVFTLPRLQYNPTYLVEYVENLKPFRRIKILPWRNLNEYREKLAGISIDDPKVPASVVSNKNYMMIDPTQQNLMYDFSKDNFINSILYRTNLKADEIFVIEIIFYKKGYIFRPHTDALIKCKIMIPASLDKNLITPIDFYTSKTNYLQSGKTYDNSDIVLSYRHFYDNNFPTVINTTQIHGVESMICDRTMITIGLSIDFENFYQQCKVLDII